MAWEDGAAAGRRRQFGAHLSDFARVRQWGSMTGIGSDVIPAKAGIHHSRIGVRNAVGTAMDPGWSLSSGAPQARPGGRGDDEGG